MPVVGAGQPELLANLLSGLVGAIVGAIVAVVAAILIQRREFDRRSRGAARAVYQELRGNIVKLRIFADGGPADALDSDIYRAFLPEIAFWLGADELAKVSVAYTSAPAYARAIEAKIAAAQAGQAVDPQVDKSVRSLLRIMRTARDTLRDRAWSPEEVKRMKEAGDEEKAKLDLDV